MSKMQKIRYYNLDKPYDGYTRIEFQGQCIIRWAEDIDTLYYNNYETDGEHWKDLLNLTEVPEKLYSKDIKIEKHKS